VQSCNSLSERYFHRSCFLLAFLLCFCLNAFTHATAQTTPVGNAADSWRALRPLLLPQSASNPKGLLTEEQWDEFQNDLSEEILSPEKMELRKLRVSQLQPLLTLIHEAAAQPRCDFEYDHSKGFDLVMPELVEMRKAARVLRTVGKVHQDDGDMQGFVDSQSAIAHIALFPGQSKILIGSLVGQSIANLSMFNIDSAIEDGLLSQSQAKELLQSIEPFTNEDAFHTNDCMMTEYQLLEASFRNANPKESLLSNITKRLDRQPNLAEGDNNEVDNNEALIKCLPVWKPIYEQLAVVMREPDAIKRDEMENKLMARVAALEPPANMLNLFLPAVMKTVNSRNQTNTKALTLQQTLKQISEDPDAALRFTSLEVLWLRIAAQANALSTDSQTAVEIFRNQGADNAGQFAKPAMTCLQHCDKTIFASMRLAAARGAARFSFHRRGLRLLENGAPMLSMLGGLRGAARLSAAQSTLLDTDKAISQIDLVFAVIAALAIDPSQSSSCTSAAIAKELVPAVCALAKRADMTTERKEKLQAAVNRIQRTDPFGFKASLLAERKQLRSELYWMNPENPQALAQDISRRNAEWVMAVLVATNDPVNQQQESVGVLVDTSDLFPADRLLAAKIANESLTQLLLKARNEMNRRDESDDSEVALPVKGSGLSKIVVAPLRDPAMDLQEALETLSKLDAALRGE